MAQGDLLTLTQAVAWRESLRQSGRKLVVTNGCFDILHRGHVEYLAQAAALGDELLVLVNSDASVRELKGPTRPVNNEIDRAFLLTALKSVSKAVIFPTARCNQELDALSPDVYAKAGDYTLAKLDPAERAALEKHGTQIVFLPFVSGHSTTGIIEKLQK